MQSQNGMNPGIGGPMRRVKHTTTIEEPDKNQNGVQDRFEGGGGLQTGPGGGGGRGMGFLQNMVHPAFRAQFPGAGQAPSMGAAPRGTGQGGISVPSRPPGQVGLDPMERLRRGGFPPMLIPFFQRLFGQGV